MSRATIPYGLPRLHCDPSASRITFAELRWLKRFLPDAYDARHVWAVRERAYRRAPSATTQDERELAALAYLAQLGAVQERVQDELRRSDVAPRREALFRPLLERLQGLMDEVARSESTSPLQPSIGWRPCRE